jgi:hypothetical protein
MGMRAIPTNKTKSKVPPSRLQVYLGDEAIGAALDREAKVNRISLSQAAVMMIQRGLKNRISADPADRLLVLERRLSDHMRLTARDLVIIEEMLFVSLRMMLSRFPEAEEEKSGPYQASVEASLQVMMGEVAERVRRTSAGKIVPSRTDASDVAPSPANDPNGDITSDGDLFDAWSSEA